MKPPAKTEIRIFIIAAVVMAAVSVYATRVADPDMWGHLLYGKFFFENGWQTTDPFAYTSAGLRWSPAEYLAQIVLYFSYFCGGAFGMVVLKTFVGAAAAFFLYLAVRAGCSDARLWSPVFILGIGIVGRSFLFRPQLFSFMFFCWFVAVLVRCLLKKTTNGPPRFWADLLWTLPIVTAVWANMHGAFMAGLGAIGLALILRLCQSIFVHALRLTPALRAIWPLALTLAACFAASLLTPQGILLWNYLIREMSHDTNRRLIEEWRPLDFHAHTWSALTLILLLAALLFSGIMAQWRGLRIAGLPPWLWLLSCLPLTLMAFQAVRHIPILAIWATPVLALLAQSAADGWKDKTPWQLGWLGFTALIALPALLTLTYRVVLQPLPAIRIGAEEKRPLLVADFMRRNRIEGNVYNPLWWGSYLSWELYPKIRVAMDGRNVTLFPTEMVEENLSFFTEPAKNIDMNVPSKYQTDFLLAPKTSGAIQLIEKDKRWFRLYEDENAVLFVRDDERHAKWKRRKQQRRLESPKIADPVYFR